MRCKMLVKTPIRLGDQLPVETPFVDPNLIARHQKNALSFGVKGEGDTPHTRTNLASQLLHLRVPRPLQNIRVGAPQAGTFPFQEDGFGEDGIPHRLGEIVKLSLEVGVEYNLPSHVLYGP